MSDFIRPEARRALWRFRDTLGGLALALLGGWLALGGLGITRWIGLILAVVGLAWAVAGVQRARFRQGDDGPGVVQIRERRLGYFGPLEGGVLDLDDIARLEFDPTGHPSAYWVVGGRDGQRLAIPVDAAGAEGLFDLFSALPGIRMQPLLDVLTHPPAGRRLLWERRPTLLH